MYPLMVWFSPVVGWCGRGILNRCGFGEVVWYTLVQGEAREDEDLLQQHHLHPVAGGGVAE